MNTTEIQIQTQDQPDSMSNSVSPDTLLHAIPHCSTLISGGPPPVPSFKQRSDSVLRSLSPAQQFDLFNWLCVDSYEDVLKRLSENFGIQTHRNTLHRFYHQYAKRLNAQQITDLLQHSADDPTPPQLAEASQTALLHRLFQLAHTPEALGRINELSRTLARHQHHQTRQKFLHLAEQQTQLARDRLTLQTRAFEFNASRKALDNAHKLLEILADQKLDDQDKITHAHQLLFKKGESI